MKRSELKKNLNEAVELYRKFANANPKVAEELFARMEAAELALLKAKYPSWHLIVPAHGG